MTSSGRRPPAMSSDDETAGRALPALAAGSATTRPATRHDRWRWAFRGIGPLCVLACGTAAADVVVWPTYLRAAPDRHATVIAELQRAKPVEVAGCDRRWCRVEVDGAAGYVDRRNVGPVPPPATFDPPTDRSGCFDARRAGYQRGEPLVFCARREAAAAQR